MSRLDLVVGPNGAGKSTFVRLVLLPERPGAVFVNADEIAAERWPDDPAAHAYDAAAEAARTRQRLLELRRPFLAETVFSHPSKLQLVAEARGAGYDVTLHVLMVPEKLAVGRVAARVRAGGHGVPEEKIRQRYRRLWRHVADAASLVDDAWFWNNEDDDGGPEIVAAFVQGMVVDGPRWPPWTPAALEAARSRCADNVHYVN